MNLLRLYWGCFARKYDPEFGEFARLSIDLN